MARINIEDKIFTDLRFLNLCDDIGRKEALYQIVTLWFLAQRFWVEGKLIPIDVYEIHEFSPSIIKRGLAVRSENGIYVKGSEKQFKWLKQKKEAGKKGGLASGSVRKENKHLNEAARSGSNPQSQSQSQSHINNNNKRVRNKVNNGSSKLVDWESIRPSVVDKAKTMFGYNDEFCDITWERLLAYDQDKPFKRRRSGAINWFSSHITQEAWQKYKQQKTTNGITVELLKQYGFETGEGFITWDEQSNG